MRAVALLLTVFTGFSGLVYEVSWQKYVATLLGSHSEATAAVLGIFLAGLSAGYSIFGGVTKRQVTAAAAAGRAPHLLRTYGLIEVGIGVYAGAFPWLFEAVRSISYAIPHEASGLGFAFDVLLVALLLGPPTVLMGGTVPILTQALSHDLEDATRFHALVYSLNTAGAFAGALVGSFLLIPSLGLNGTIFAMSAINLLAGGIFLLLGRRQVFISLEEEARPGVPEGFRTYAAVALLSGFALMVIQNVAIRVGGLSLGSSEYTFGMVVAVFVLCIAVGSFLVSLFPDLPSRYLVINQCVLAILVIALYLPVESAPYWAYRMRIEFGSSLSDFFLYYLASFGGLLIILGPFAILSGAILPLLFHHLRRQVGDLGSIAGKLYSWNTAGSLFGALLGGYLLLFFLDLHHVYRIAASALVLSAGLLALRVLSNLRREAVAAAVIACIIGMWLLPAWNSTYLTLGLFRTRSAEDGDGSSLEVLAKQRRADLGRELIFHDDDPTVTVSVIQHEGADGTMSRSIVSNGKSDGSTGGDYPTMGLAALIPALMAHKLERSFVVGFGTGVTVGELMSLKDMREVTVAEISPGVIEASPLFDFANLGVTTNPKVSIVRSDAYRALMRSSGEFDVIVSEPSNPWVTGVEMLYSQEFLTVARSRLAGGGVYCQWFHQYESDADSVALVIRTFASVFERIAIWYGLGPDLLIIGFDDPTYLPTVGKFRHRFRKPDFRKGFARSSVKSLPALLAHEMVPVGAVTASQYQGPVHTLYRPILNHLAGVAFFRGNAGTLRHIRSGAALEVGIETSMLGRYLADFDGEAREVVQAKATMEACSHRRDLCAVLLAEWQARDPASKDLDEVRKRAFRGAKLYGGSLDQQLLDRIVPLFGRADGADQKPVRFADVRAEHVLFQKLFQFFAPFDANYLVSRWERCDAPEKAAGLCEKGLEHARGFLSP